MEWQSEVESSLSQSLHPFSIEGRMECIDYFNANSLSVIELFNSKLQINDFSDTSNTVFVEKRFIVVLRPRCKWDSVEIVSWWRLLSEILYLYLFFFFFPTGRALMEISLLRTVHWEYPPEVTWMLAWADSLLEPLAQSHCLLSCYPKSNLKIQTQVCSQHQGKSKQKTTIKTISTSLPEQEVIAPIEDVDA